MPGAVATELRLSRVPAGFIYLFSEAGRGRAGFAGAHAATDVSYHRFHRPD